MMKVADSILKIQWSTQIYRPDSTCIWLNKTFDSYNICLDKENEIHIEEKNDYWGLNNLLRLSHAET